MKFRKKS